MYAAVLYFWILMIIMGMKNEKIILKILFRHLSRSNIIFNWNWLEEYIGDEKTAISTVDISLSYKRFFVLGMLHTSRGHNSTM